MKIILYLLLCTLNTCVGIYMFTLRVCSNTIVFFPPYFRRPSAHPSGCGFLIHTFSPRPPPCSPLSRDPRPRRCSFSFDEKKKRPPVGGRQEGSRYSAYNNRFFSHPSAEVPLYDKLDFSNPSAFLVYIRRIISAIAILRLVRRHRLANLYSDDTRAIFI